MLLGGGNVMARPKRRVEVVVDQQPGSTYMDFLKARLQGAQPSYLDCLSGGELRARLNQSLGE